MYLSKKPNEIHQTSLLPQLMLIVVILISNLGFSTIFILRQIFLYKVKIIHYFD